jgi:hypothetical protein
MPMTRYSAILVIALCLCGLAGITGIALADEAIPTVNHVYFFRDGAPYHESVTFTVKCYGFPTESYYPPGASMPAFRTRNVTEPELLGSFSASCPSFGCMIYETYRRFKFNMFDWCDLEGETRGENFILRNVTLPVQNGLPSCQNIPMTITLNGSRYYQSDEWYDCTRPNYDTSVRKIFYVSCDPAKEYGCIDLFAERGPVRQASYQIIPKKANNMTPGQYIHYLVSCDPIDDGQCPGMVIDNKPVKEMGTEYHPLFNASSEKIQDACARFLYNANPALIIPKSVEDPYAWTGYTAYEECELRFNLSRAEFTPRTLPGSETPITGSISEKQIPVSPLPTLLPTYIPRSPVESLYCTILSIFGVEC